MSSLSIKIYQKQNGQIISREISTTADIFHLLVFSNLQFPTQHIVHKKINVCVMNEVMAFCALISISPSSFFF